VNFRNQIRKVIFKSLIKENQAFEALEQQLSKVEDTFISFSQSRIEELDKELQSAKEEKEFGRFRRALEEKSQALSDLVDAHEKKMEILRKMSESIKSEVDIANTQGEKVFSDNEIDAFDAQELQAGQRFRIESNASFIEVEKISEENNQFRLEDGNIQGLKAGDVLQIQGFSVGGDSNITVYRKIGERYEKLSDFVLSNIISIVENPA
jgi:exonuclease VII large subunit